jgi:hypothetical protein
VDVHALRLQVPADMRVVSIALLTAALATSGCHKSSSAPAAAQLQPQEVNWNQSAEPASPHKTQRGLPDITVEQLAVNGSNVDVRFTNVKPGTGLTLAWFGPNGWSVTNQYQAANGNTATFAIPKFGTPGRYEAELLDDNLRLLGTVDVNV